MPPRAKFSKEEIIDAALKIVRTDGLENLTARALGQMLGSSACPIFTVFKNMDEVQQGVMEAIRHIYKGYIEKGLSESLAFKGVGTQYILFAINEPKLFQILFMSEQPQKPCLSNVLPLIDESYNSILASITAGYGIKGENAERMYKHLWIYTHGIATLCATKMCRFTGEEINRLISDEFLAIKDRINGESAND